ncbi:rhomboid family protein [Leeuwenhoekiella aestuarii]|uniref:Rhomboid family protein n=1 Tax=Leeuwenhoekiella aestuarii TaxID=2249426 RepID=A0A4Q0NUR7_9FLAO|nr:rhomboid family intramembrane serine protease [Leeuwenhoekiella aestuarii]RXG15461.1 rhomboid family protein [Leeuwenhoekiella aestuarii]RXG17432.1 rhomboid family protein [Leeuwenhoekiella aestuarii]
MGDLNLITVVVIGINVLISMKGFNDYSFFEKYKFNTGAVRRGEQIRILSSGFLHVSTSHLFFNMLTLYFFAPIVINLLGNWEFVIIYLGSLILGNLLSYYFHKDEYHYTAVGASGAVSGILYSAILLNPDMSLYMILIPVPIPAYIFGIGYLLYSIYGMRANNDNIGHDAHFGGAVGGYVITLLMAPILLQINTLMVGLLAIPIVILFVLSKTGKL